MRVWAVLLTLSLLAAVPAAPSEAGHPESFDHGTLFIRDAGNPLVPSEEVTLHLAFGGAPLLGGWVFLLVAKVQGATLDATLSIGGQHVTSWSIPPTSQGRWAATTVLPQDGSYDLTVTNVGIADATFAIYFDQSCNCAAKFIPADIPDGLIIFNTDVEEPSSVFAQFNEPRAMRIRVTAALLGNPRALWPQDFTILAVSESPVQRQVSPELPPVWLHELRVEVDRPARLYYIVEGVAFDAARYSDPQDLLVSPLYQKTPRVPGVSPWIVGAFVGAAILAVAVFFWRGRQAAKADRRNAKEAVKPRGGARGGRRTRTSQRRRRRK